MKAATTILATAVLAAASTPGLAADTPKQRYGNDMTCTAVITAAIDQNALPANIASDKAASLRTIYVRRAQASGHDAGIAPAKVSSDIDSMRTTIVARMNGSNPSKASAERADAASMTTNCAALLGFELENKVMSHGSHQ